jgi:hypothetical protein
MVHWLYNLEVLIKEAIYLYRIPVITPPLLHPMHNFGIKLTSHWSKYLNISRTEVYIKDNGEFKQMQKPFLAIFEEDFKQLKFGEGQVYKINACHEITEAENKRYQLIVRSVSSIRRGLWGYAISPEIKKNMRVNFVWSDDVVRISKNIIDKLGWYAAIHVRRGDKLKVEKNLKKFTSPEHIFKMIKDIVPLHSNIYILTDEKDRNFFEYLREHYRIYQYFDFDELTVIVSGQEPDNNFLFLIEKRIFENAAKKIETFKLPAGYSLWQSAEYSLSRYTRMQFSINFKLRRFYRKKIPITLRHSFKRLRIKLRNIIIRQ